MFTLKDLWTSPAFPLFGRVVHYIFLKMILYKIKANKIKQKKGSTINRTYTGLYARLECSKETEHDNGWCSTKCPRQKCKRYSKFESPTRQLWIPSAEKHVPFKQNHNTSSWARCSKGQKCSYPVSNDKQTHEKSIVEIPFDCQGIHVKACKSQAPQWL